MAGRKPKPTALKVIAGNPGGRPLPKNEPKPKADTGRCPTRLKGMARKEWNRLVPILKDAGLFTRVDRNAMAMYCDQYSIYCEAMKSINDVGAVIKDSQNRPAQNPYFRVANKASGIMSRMLVEFGMTPSSRSRVQVVPPEGATQDEWADFD